MFPSWSLDEGISLNKGPGCVDCKCLCMPESHSDAHMTRDLQEGSEPHLSFHTYFRHVLTKCPGEWNHPLVYYVSLFPSLLCLLWLFVCQSPIVEFFQVKGILEGMPLNYPPSFQLANETNEKQNKFFVFHGPELRLSQAMEFGLWLLGGGSNPLPRSLWAWSHVIHSFHGTDCTQCPSVQGMGCTRHKTLSWGVTLALEEGTEERTNEHSLDIWACRKLRQSSCLSRVTNHPGLRGPASFNTKSSTNREIPQSGQTEKLTTLHLA